MVNQKPQVISYTKEKILLLMTRKVDQKLQCMLVINCIQNKHKNNVRNYRLQYLVANLLKYTT